MQNSYKLFLTPLAAKDIEATLEYIAVNLCNAKAARDLYLKIEKTFEEICRFPYSSTDCNVFLISDKNIRHVVIANYVLVFEIKQSEGQVNVLRFRYGKTDFTKLNLNKDGIMLNTGNKQTD